MSAKQLEQIGSELQRLSDIEAISQLKARQIRLVDTKEWDTWGKEVLAEDFQLHGDGGITEGRANAIASVSKALAEATTVHRIHPGEIVITGPDTASAVWPMDDYVTMTHKGSPMAFRGYGYYHDDYVRTEQGWRIKRSKLIRQRVDTGRG